MNYTAALSDFFKSPKWLNNLLLGGVCILIPIVGPIALTGWHVNGFWARKDPDDFVNYPTFDFSSFGKYLERGIWPFLVMLVPAVVMVPVAMILMVSMIAALPAQAIAGDASGDANVAVQAFPILGFSLGMILWVIAMVAMVLLMHPLRIFSALSQDFGSAFKFGRLRHFIGLMWPELLVSALFLWVVAMGLILVGMVAVCIGMYFTMSVLYFVNAHLERQLYHVYLSRGGEPVAPSPKLTDFPPPLPPTSLPPSMPSAS